MPKFVAYSPNGTAYECDTLAEAKRVQGGQLSLSFGASPPRRSSLYHQKGSESTQVPNTVGTYAKAAARLAAAGVQGPVLDYGAGMGLGADAMRKVFSTVDTLEPAPVRWQSRTPVTYQTADQVGKQYAGVVCLNVLNVLEPALRHAVAKSVCDLTADGGRVIVGVRGAAAVLDTKTGRRGEEAASVWIPKKWSGQEIEVYQKGFTPTELVAYMQSVSGDGWNWRPVHGLTDVAVEGQRPQRGTMPKQNPTRGRHTSPLAQQHTAEGLYQRMMDDGADTFSKKVRWVSRHLPDVDDPQSFVGWVVKSQRNPVCGCRHNPACACGGACRNPACKCSNPRKVSKQQVGLFDVPSQESVNSCATTLITSRWHEVPEAKVKRCGSMMAQKRWSEERARQKKNPMHQGWDGRTCQSCGRTAKFFTPSAIGGWMLCDTCAPIPRPAHRPKSKYADLARRGSKLSVEEMRELDEGLKYNPMSHLAHERLEEQQFAGLLAALPEGQTVTLGRGCRVRRLSKGYFVVNGERLTTKQAAIRLHRGK